MGVDNWLQWLAWFLKYLLFVGVINVVITILVFVDFKSGAVYQHADASLFLVFIMLYATNVILMCFALAVFFTSRKFKLYYRIRSCMPPPSCKPPPFL